MKRRHIPVHRPGPVQRALIVQQWQHSAVAAQIHVLIGDDSDALIDGAGRVLYVVLGAAAAAGMDGTEPDLRIARGACGALLDQAGEPLVHDVHRRALISGLQACERLLPQLHRRDLASAAIDLDARLNAGDINASHFDALMRRVARAPENIAACVPLARAKG